MVRLIIEVEIDNLWKISTSFFQSSEKWKIEIIKNNEREKIGYINHKKKVRIVIDKYIIKIYKT